MSSEKSQKRNPQLLIPILCSLMLLSAAHAWAATGPVAVTADGVFRGISTPTMNEFLGIRYAQAPEGDLRWRPPRRPERVHGIQDAAQFQSHCPQPASPFGLASASEDCLFLNV